MHMIDISWPILENITAYKDRAVVKIEQIKNFEEHQVRESRIILSSHTGTHIDAPAHFLEQGKTVDQIPLDAASGPCKVLDMMHVTEKITCQDLAQNAIDRGDIILFKTRNSQCLITDAFDYNFVYLDASGAEYIASRGVKAVGIDYLGIERNQPTHETHSILMQASILIIEGLRLGHVDAGDYMLICLPLSLQGLDGAPARAILTR